MQRMEGEDWKNKIREIEIHSINDRIKNNQSEMLQEDLPLQQFYNKEEEMIYKGKGVGGSLLEVLTGVWVERFALALYPLYHYLSFSSHSGPPPTRTSKLYPRSWFLSGSFSMSSLLKLYSL